MDCKYSVLDTQNSIPTYCFKEARKIWGEKEEGDLTFLIAFYIDYL